MSFTDEDYGDPDGKGADAKASEDVFVGSLAPLLADSADQQPSPTIPISPSAVPPAAPSQQYAPPIFQRPPLVHQSSAGEELNSTGPLSVGSTSQTARRAVTNAIMNPAVLKAEIDHHGGSSREPDSSSEISLLK